MYAQPVLVGSVVHEHPDLWGGACPLCVVASDAAGHCVVASALCSQAHVWLRLGHVAPRFLDYLLQGFYTRILGPEG